jgi:hypothetical protein
LVANQLSRTFFNRPSNSSCHNLCSILPPPYLYRTLLGLGLNFCPLPLQSTGNSISHTVDRFRKDIHTKILFAGSPNDDWINSKRLFLRSTWSPDPEEIPRDIRSRISTFLGQLERKFKRRDVPTNLTPYQTKLLEVLRDSEDHIVIPTDKNLGPAILERTVYTQRAFDDHLNDETTYLRLSASDADTRMAAIAAKILKFINNEAFRLPKDERTYLERSLKVKDKYAYFYLVAKIHKNPWATRPIVSISGSITHGLGRWLDKELQPICRKLQSFISSSFDLKTELASLSIDPSRARFFTADAVSMYTNIDTTHALGVISTFLRHSKHCRGVAAEPIICALEIIMRNNLFKFGDTYWLQITGTAMGTPPACMYAILYYGIHELNFLPRFQATVPFYKRYIDDVLGIFIMDEDEETDKRNWSEFQQAMPFGSLKWEFSERTTTVNFLDLTLTLNHQRIVTRLYEKPLNLYLYIPPHSAHPPGILRGMITGYITRVFRLTTTKTDCEASIRTFFRRLCDRGYTPCRLRPLFHDALKRAQTSRCKPSDDNEERIFLHLEYHPYDPPSRVLQCLFRELLKSPANEPELSTLRNKNNVPNGINRMIVAFKRPRNLKNTLFPRRFREAPNAPASKFARTQLVPVSLVAAGSTEA